VTFLVNTGYDNMEVNLEPVLDYIKAQNYKALEHEQNAKREAGMNKWEVSALCLAVEAHQCLINTSSMPHQCLDCCMTAPGMPRKLGNI